jgi:hypothetical protein
VAFGGIRCGRLSRRPRTDRGADLRGDPGTASWSSNRNLAAMRRPDRTKKAPRRREISTMPRAMPRLPEANPRVTPRLAPTRSRDSGFESRVSRCPLASKPLGGKSPWQGLRRRRGLSRFVVPPWDVAMEARVRAPSHHGRSDPTDRTAKRGAVLVATARHKTALGRIRSTWPHCWGNALWARRRIAESGAKRNLPPRRVARPAARASVSGGISCG